MQIRQMRRDRAARNGPVLFVHERAFEDICDRLAAIRRRFRSALLIGTTDPSWPERLGNHAAEVTAFDPAPAAALAAGALHMAEEHAEIAPASFDLCIAAGTLDTVGDLPGTLSRIRRWLAPDSLLIGAIPGGDTLPRLRASMRAGDSLAGAAAPHIHPRIAAASLGHLLAAAGFVMPVVDVDRVRVAYPTLAALVADLRGMGVTNMLRARSRGLSRAALAAAEDHFESFGEDGRTVETFELLHFAAWTPDQG